MPSKESLINDFVDRSFRDVADRDYIAARIVFRYGLEQQFLWFAQQAIEKYLKAILLYSRVDTRNYGHNLSDTYDALLKIPDIDFDFPDDIRLFIKYLDSYGFNRYFEVPYHLIGEECIYLDRAVWFIRRYCYHLYSKITTPTGEVINLFPYEIEKIQNPKTIAKPHKYYIYGGYLETVLKKKGSSLRNQLVYRNFYYGTYKKKLIKNYKMRMSYAKPTHCMHPEVFSDLDKIVKFSKNVRHYFKTKLTSNKS